MGEEDTFPFVLAKDLGLTLRDIDAMPYEEYVRWRAFYVYEAAMADFRMREKKGRG